MLLGRAIDQCIEEKSSGGEIDHGVPVMPAGLIFPQGRPKSRLAPSRFAAKSPCQSWR